MKESLWRKNLLAMLVGVTLTACSSTPTATKPEEQNNMHVEEKIDEHQLNWSYAGETGPEQWGTLDPSFSICKDGKEQSPINLKEAKETTTAEADIQINYHPSLFTIKNNGHTVQADAVPSDNILVLDGKEYKLVQFHFHVPSEHQLEGKNLDMELHFVHKNEENELAVVGVLMKEGNQNQSLAGLWSKLPEEETKENIELEKKIDLPSLLPQNKTAFHYNGSLTTPPCSEGVKWIVLEEPIEVSKEQIDTFASIFPGSHRPVQPWNDRDVYEVLTK